MKNKLTFLILILILTFQLVLSETETHKFSIALSKHSYLLNEPIWLDVTLLNSSLDTLRLQRICLECRDNTLNFEVRGQDRKIFNYTGDVWSVAQSSFKGYLYEKKDGIYKGGVINFV